MARTLVIAEIGSSWDGDCHKAERLIKAAKDCDADVAKFQWTSDPAAMAKRRGLGSDAEAMYRKYLAYPAQFLTDFKRICDTFGIEFACTVYLPQDIATIAPLVKRFKVSAFEAQWKEFVEAHYRHDKPIVLSSNDPDTYKTDYGNPDVSTLWCVSQYPTPVENVKLRSLWNQAPRYFIRFDGFSDHTANVLTGAAAVAAGAKIVEAHIRLHDTDKGNPDYGHSLVADCSHGHNKCTSGFIEYVNNIREVERML